VGYDVLDSVEHYDAVFGLVQEIGDHEMDRGMSVGVMHFSPASAFCVSQTMGVLRRPQRSRTVSGRRRVTQSPACRG